MGFCYKFVLVSSRTNNFVLQHNEHLNCCITVELNNLCIVVMMRCSKSFSAVTLDSYTFHISRITYSVCSSVFITM